MTSADVVAAVYRALLGHDPDPEGLAFWKAAGSVDDLIAALASTPRFRERSASLLSGARSNTVSASDEVVRGAWRLEHGRGLEELVDLPPDISRPSGFEVLPWAEIIPSVEAPTVRVVGGYAQQLANELARRFPGTRCIAGIEDPERAVDALVLTGSAELDVLAWAMPGLIRAVRRRIALPSLVSARQPPDEVAALRRSLRTRIHGLGFVQVRHVFRPRQAGAELLLDITSGTPEGGFLVTSSADRMLPNPSASWLVGDRCADEDAR